jgi:Ca2+/Na+ antiporter
VAMKKKSLFLFLLLVILSIIGLFLFYRFTQWYEQLLGSIFSYIVMISLALFIFAPFRYIKDKKTNINIFSYIKYLGVTILVLVKFVVNVLKEIVLTFSYIVTRIFSNKNFYQPKKESPKQSDQESSQE